MKGRYILMDENRAFELLGELAFTRMSGTDEELRAARILAREAQQIGVECEIEPFTVHDGIVERAELEVLEPFRAKYEVTGMRRSLDTGDEGITAELVYVENAMEANLVGVKDKIVLYNGYLNYDPYERIQRAGAKGVIAFSGSILDDPGEMEIALRMLRPKMTDAWGDTYAVNMRAADAMDMIRRGATRVRIVVRSRKADMTSHNVYATIPGTDLADEIVSFGAHYDSTEYSKGVYDNGSGSVILVELMRYFKQHPPRRTLKFMWFGSEEVGLCGSTYFCEAHKDELERHKIMINVDMAAPILGYDICITMGDDALMHYVDGMMRENGLPVRVSSDTYSSDSIPFTDNGVPAVNFARFAAPGAGFGHDRRDVMDFLSAPALKKTMLSSFTFAERVANAPVMPFERKVSPEMKDKVDRYLKRKK